MMTSVQLAEKLGVSTMLINYYARRLKIKCSAEMVGNRKMNVYADKDAEAIEAAFLHNSGKKLTLEEMKALHPLVKDERLFREDYFPDMEIETE